MRDWDIICYARFRQRVKESSYGWPRGEILFSSYLNSPIFYIERWRDAQNQAPSRLYNVVLVYKAAQLAHTQRIAEVPLRKTN